MKLSKRRLLGFIFLYLSIAAFAKGYEGSLMARQLTIADGLPTNTVRAMVQDKDGYIWMGSTTGLTRYDGYSCVTFKDDKSSSNYIGVLDYDSRNNLLWAFTSTYIVKCLDLNKGAYVDYTSRNDAEKAYRKHLMAENGIWLYTEQYGIRHVTYDNGSFTTTDYNTSNHTLPENKVSYMVSDKDNNVWAIASHHVIKIDKNGKPTIVNKAILPIDIRSKGNHILILDDSNTIWHYKASGALSRKVKLPIMLGTISKVTTSMVWQGRYYIFTPSATFAYDIASGQWSKPDDIQIPWGLDQGCTNGYRFIANNKDGNLWIFPAKGSQRQLRLMNHISADPGREHIYNIVPLADSILAIATYGEGLVVYNTKTGDMKRHKAEDKEPLFHSNYLFHIIKDLQQGIWIAADAAGVSYVLPKPEPVATYIVPCPDRRGSRDNGIMRTTRLKSGEILVSTYNNTNYILNLSTSTLTPYTRLNYSLSAYAIDHNGSEWIALSKHGISVDGKVYTSADKQTGLPSNDIRDIAVDKHGRVWLAAVDGGLAYCMPKRGEMPKFKVLLNENINQRRIPKIDISDSGWLFVATNTGIYAIDANKKTITKDDILNFNADNKALPSNQIYSLKTVGTDCLWISTTGLGVMKATFNAHEKKLSYVKINHSNGLPSDNVASIVQGKGNHIWLGTENGLAMVDGDNLWAQSFSPSPTIMGNIFSSTNGMQLPDGRILLGSNEGIAIINDNILGDTAGKTSKPQLTDLIVNGKSVFNSELLLDNPFGKRQLSVAYDQSNIELHFSNLDYPAIASTLYDFYLEGIDDTWRGATNFNRAEYSHLAPATYTFHVKAMAGNKWSDEATFQITVRQPWYNTLLAWLVYMLALAAIATVIYRQWRRNFELNQRMELEKQITDFRISFFTNIAHEFRTPLAIIEGAVNKLEAIKKGETAGSQRTTMQMVKRGTNRLLRLVNELMEFRKINTGNARLALQQCDIIETIRNVYNDFRTLAQQKKQNITFVPFDKQFTAAFDKAKIETIAYNLLSNAVKYTPERGEISITIKHAENTIVMAISDSGPGISQHQQQSLFTPFMHGYVSKGGMGIGLYTAYNMAQLHHGSLEYVRKEHGSTFVLTLPDSDAPYSADDYMQQTAIDTSSHTNDKADEIIRELQSEALNDETIAIIEDDADMMEQISNELSTYFKVERYSNGAEGYNGVLASKPALVVCDVMLPDMDGYEIVAKLKQNTEMDNVPVIMLTALDDVNHQIKGYKAGADDYMVKPCNYHLLVARAIQLITWAKARQAKYAAVPAADGTEPSVPAKIVTSMADKNFKHDVDYQIAQHISDPDFNVEQLAALVQMGHTKFYSKVKELMGMSPNKYIMGERMRIAAELVLEGRLNISEIAYKVGFQDPSYFNKCFKKQFGCIPSKYGK